jgi:hypothetical protein
MMKYNIEYRAVGMILLSKLENEWYILIGKESNLNRRKKKWSFIGGCTEKGETPFYSAARELYEETLGMLFNQENSEGFLRKNIKFNLDTGWVKYPVKTFVVEMDHNKEIEENFSEYYNSLKEYYNKNNIKYPKGFFEINEYKWIKLNELYNIIEDCKVISGVIKRDLNQYIGHDLKLLKDLFIENKYLNIASSETACSS